MLRISNKIRAKTFSNEQRFYFVFQAVNSILRHVAQIQGFKSNEELEDLYRKTAWKFEAKNKKKGSSYDWFKQVSWF